MKAIELLKEYYPELTEKIAKLYPAFLETAKEVEVIPWQEEFQIADRNPEVIEELEFWNILFDSNLLSKEEWRAKTNQVLKKVGYASKTMGIAFIEKREVSFRQKVPNKVVLIHEIGHVHFQEIDSFWSATYGGGEILFWLGIEKGLSIPEEGIRKFMELFRRAYEGEHLEVAHEIVEQIASLYGDQIVPHFYTICLYTGWMPEGVASFGIDIFDLKNLKWLEVKPFRKDVIMFFPNLTSGLQCADLFWMEYAKRLGILKAS